MSIFKGSGVALITPFTDNGEKIDYETLEKLIEFQIKNQTDAIIICGTTGETPTLTEEEHIKTIQTCVEIVSKRIPVIAGTGSNNTQKAIKISKLAEKVGVDGLLVVTPYYNKTTQKGLREYYSQISKNANVPILMYNVPSRTGCNIVPETVLQIIKENKNIIGIKEASGNISQISKLVQKAYEEKIKIDLYSGNDDQTLPILSLGGIGVISVTANIVPKENHDLVYNYLNNNINGSLKLQYQMTELSEVLFSEVNPIPVKEATYQLGLTPNNICRSPLVSMEEQNINSLKKVLKKQKLMK